jgi:hypothetical protein
MAIAANRINGTMLPRFEGQRVLICGQVMSQDGQSAQILCSGNAQVRVQMIPGSIYNNAFVEIVGIASNGVVREERSVDMGDNFNLGHYDQVVQMANGKFKHLFS